MLPRFQGLQRPMILLLAKVRPGKAQVVLIIACEIVHEWQMRARASIDVYGA